MGFGSRSIRHADTSVMSVHYKYSTKKSGIDDQHDGSVVKMAAFWVKIKLV